MQENLNIKNKLCDRHCLLESLKSALLPQCASDFVRFDFIEYRSILEVREDLRKPKGAKYGVQ